MAGSVVWIIIIVRESKQSGAPIYWVLSTFVQLLLRIAPVDWVISMCAAVQLWRTAYVSADSCLYQRTATQPNGSLLRLQHVLIVFLAD